MIGFLEEQAISSNKQVYLLATECSFDMFLGSSVGRYTYEVAPVFLLTEDAVLKKMMEFVGWEKEGDGIFSPGE